jgi:hypothetical protein
MKIKGADEPVLAVACIQHSVFGPNLLGGLNKFSRFQVPIRTTMTLPPWCADAVKPVVPGRSVLPTAYAEKIIRRSRVDRLAGPSESRMSSAPPIHSGLNIDHGTRAV